MADSLFTAPGRIARAVSLAAVDSDWFQTLSGSTLIKCLARLRSALSGQLGEKGRSFGTLLQRLSFYVLIALALALGLPQFASDKEGLALIVLAAFLLRLAGTLLGGREKMQSTAVDLIVLAYMSIYVVAALSSHYVLPSLKGLSKVVVYGLAYFTMVQAMSVNNKRPLAVCLALVFSAFLVSVYGLYQYKIGVAPLATWEDPTVEVKGTRIYSTLGNPNLLAGYLTPLLPLSLCLSLSSLLSRKFVSALALGLVSAVIFAACLLTGSRGAYIGVAAATGSLCFVLCRWLWQDRPRLRICVGVACLLIPLAAFALVHFVPGMEQRLASIFVGREHSSNSFRLNVWMSSWEMFKDSWWIGVGPGNQTFRLAYGLYMRSGYDALGTYCVPLEIAVEAGLGALALFLALVAAVFARAHCQFWASKDSGRRLLILGAVGALCGLLAHGLVDTVFYRPQVQLIFWFMVATVVALEASAPRQTDQETGKPGAS